MDDAREEDAGVDEMGVDHREEEPLATCEEFLYVGVVGETSMVDERVLF